MSSLFSYRVFFLVSILFGLSFSSFSPYYLVTDFFSSAVLLNIPFIFLAISYYIILYLSFCLSRLNVASRHSLYFVSFMSFLHIWLIVNAVTILFCILLGWFLIIFCFFEFWMLFFIRYGSRTFSASSTSGICVLYSDLEIRSKICSRLQQCVDQT